MSWIVLVGVVLTLSLVVLSIAIRRVETNRIARQIEDLDEARRRGSHRARLQYPHIDLTRCIGCGTCVHACPEEGVLGLLHGQALVVHGARCVGHGRCAAECPTGGISIALGDVESRDDIPAIDDSFEVVGRPGLFLAGEVTGYALIRTAIAHGSAVAAQVAARCRSSSQSSGELDLVIVGLGPAGLACALGAKERGLRFVVLEQETLGGTVASYPRRKLVMTQPVELPLHGRIGRTTWSKEELMELWGELAERHELPVRSGVRFKGLEPSKNGGFIAKTDTGDVRGRFVCLALGRRGSPRKLGVPGEDLPKVAYSLLDAQSYRNRRVLVVGGGDSAVEAALGLAEQPGNHVTLSYRKHAFFRIKARNETRLGKAVASGKLTVLYSSQVETITAERVRLQVRVGDEETVLDLPNDDVFVMAGGIPPFELMKASGISFDPADRPVAPLVRERGTGLIWALVGALVLALTALTWAAWNGDYYRLPPVERANSEDHHWLRASRGVGLAFGVLALGLILTNLAYLVRRHPRIPFELGSLRLWMTSHVVTGIGAFLLVLLHAGMEPRDTVGGHALWTLAVLIMTGAIGRYLYSFVPRAANGRELEIDEVRGEVASLAAEWDRQHRGFGERVRAEVQELVQASREQNTFLSRLGSILTADRRFRRVLEGLCDEARVTGLSEDKIAHIVALAQRARRAAVSASHFEDLRGVLNGWRWLHRWGALLMVLLVALHILTALRFGEVL